MHRKEGERCASGRCAPLPPVFLAPFLFRERVRGRIYSRRWRVARPNTMCIASSVRGASCKVHSGCLLDCTGRRGAHYPFSPPWCMYTYRATCDLIHHEVQRPCHVNENSAVVRARARAHAKLCGNASGAHVLSVIMLTTGICSNESFKSVRRNVSWG